jgi:hypothetical protein
MKSLAHIRRYPLNPPLSEASPRAESRGLGFGPLSVSTPYIPIYGTAAPVRLRWTRTGLGLALDPAYTSAGLYLGGTTKWNQT